MRKMTREEADNMFLLFSQKRLFLRLINSGKSNLSDKQDVLVEDAFALANKLLNYAHQTKNVDMFNRISDATKELVPGKRMKSVMKHPEMYAKMLQVKHLFNSNMAFLARTLSK